VSLTDYPKGGEYMNKPDQGSKSGGDKGKSGDKSGSQGSEKSGSKKSE
jgi:hypothetical protein